MSFQFAKSCFFRQGCYGPGRINHASIASQTEAWRAIASNGYPRLQMATATFVSRRLIPENFRDWLAWLAATAMLGALCHGASATPSAAVPHKVGLGKVLSVKGGVGGFDIDQNGND